MTNLRSTKEIIAECEVEARNRLARKAEWIGAVIDDLVIRVAARRAIDRASDLQCPSKEMDAGGNRSAVDAGSGVAVAAAGEFLGGSADC